VNARNNRVRGSWKAAAGTVYDLCRNEAGCNAGFTEIASPSYDYTDHDVANGTTCYYHVIGHAAADPCVRLAAVVLSLGEAQVLLVEEGVRMQLLLTH
jgi:hypothetical protein